MSRMTQERPEDAKYWLGVVAPTLPEPVASMLSALYPVEEIPMEQHSFLSKIENSMSVLHREGGVSYILYLWPDLPERKLVLSVRHENRAFKVVRPVSQHSTFFGSLKSLPLSVICELRNRSNLPEAE